MLGTHGSPDLAHAFANFTVRGTAKARTATNARQVLRCLMPFMALASCSTPTVAQMPSETRTVTPAPAHSIKVATRQKNTPFCNLAPHAGGLVTAIFGAVGGDIPRDLRGKAIMGRLDELIRRNKMLSYRSKVFYAAARFEMQRENNRLAITRGYPVTPNATEQLGGSGYDDSFTYAVAYIRDILVHFYAGDGEQDIFDTHMSYIEPVQHVCQDLALLP